jgi:cytochrome c-type biogenesis protein CcmH
VRLVEEALDASMIWLAFAFMTAAAVLCVSWPLLRPRQADAAGATDVEFYRQQLSEIGADVERGLLEPTDAETSRAELGRRLLQSADRLGPATPPADGRGRSVAAALAGCFVLAATVALYAKVGNPGRPDQPLASRETDGGDFASAMAKIEAHLAAHPDDGRGVELIAPVYMRMGRFEDAARAYKDAMRLLGATPGRRAALGQALVMAADGVVTGEARQVFDAALREDPLMPQARFFAGLAALQDGDKARARTIWTALTAEAPPEAPYIGIIRQRIAELDGVAQPAMPALAQNGSNAGGAPRMDGGPVAADVLARGSGGAVPGMPAGAAAVAALPAAQQQVAIRGMVDGLAARLAQNGQDLEGWLRLVRAYRVLGQQDKARQALADARRSMGGDPQVLGRLDRLAHELGLEG